MTSCRVSSSVVAVVLVLTLTATAAAQTRPPSSWPSYESTASTPYGPPATGSDWSTTSGIPSYSAVPGYSSTAGSPPYAGTTYPGYPESGISSYAPPPSTYSATAPYASSLPPDPGYDTTRSQIAPRVTTDTTRLSSWPSVPPPPAASPVGLPGQIPTEGDVETRQSLEPIPRSTTPVRITPTMRPIEPVDLWDMSIELGVSGSEGNSETGNVRAGFDATRKSNRNKLVVDFDYKRDTAEKIKTAHRMFLDIRDDILFDESPWSLFGHCLTEYDEFRDFDARIAADLGVGYQFVETDRTTFGGRVGAGFSKEIDSPNDDYIPEAVMGLDFEHKLTDRQKLVASSTYTPDMTGFSDFRLNSKLDWEVLLDEETNLSLKFSILDRYDSTPGNAKPNDLDYSMVFLWKF